MVDVQIERAGADQLSLLLDWRMRVLDEVFAHWDGKLDPSLRQANLEYYTRHLEQGTNVSCFARHDGRIVGCGALCVQEEMPSPENPSGMVGFLMNIFVVPEHRGEGIGSSIVSWILDWAQERGITKLMLEATPAGHPVYARLGFQAADGYMIRSQIPDPERSTILH